MRQRLNQSHCYQARIERLHFGERAAVPVHSGSYHHHKVCLIMSAVWQIIDPDRTTKQQIFIEQDTSFDGLSAENELILTLTKDIGTFIPPLISSIDTNHRDDTVADPPALGDLAIYSQMTALNIPKYHVRNDNCYSLNSMLLHSITASIISWRMAKMPQLLYLGPNMSPILKTVQKACWCTTNKCTTGLYLSILIAGSFFSRFILTHHFCNYGSCANVCGSNLCHHSTNCICDCLGDDAGKI